MRIIYGDTSFLFTGDAKWDAELDMVDTGLELSSTLLSVGHYRSNISGQQQVNDNDALRYEVGIHTAGSEGLKKENPKLAGLLMPRFYGKILLILFKLNLGWCVQKLPII